MHKGRLCLLLLNTRWKRIVLHNSKAKARSSAFRFSVSKGGCDYILWTREGAPCLLLSVPGAQGIWFTEGICGNEPGPLGRRCASPALTPSAHSMQMNFEGLSRKWGGRGPACGLSAGLFDRKRFSPSAHFLTTPLLGMSWLVQKQQRTVQQGPLSPRENPRQSESCSRRFRHMHVSFYLYLIWKSQRRQEQQQQRFKWFLKGFLAAWCYARLEGLFPWTLWTIHYRVMPGRDRGKPYFPAPSIIKTRPKPYEPRTTQTILEPEKCHLALYFPFLSDIAQGPGWGILLAAGHTRL